MRGEGGMQEAMSAHPLRRIKSFVQEALRILKQRQLEVKTVSLRLKWKPRQFAMRDGMKGSDCLWRWCAGDFVQSMGSDKGDTVGDGKGLTCTEYRCLGFFRDVRGWFQASVRRK